MKQLESPECGCEEPEQPVCDIQCLNGMMRNPDPNVCECIDEPVCVVQCEAGWMNHPDPSVCECVKCDECPAGKMHDPETFNMCQCIDEPEPVCDLMCGPDQIPNSETCECEERPAACTKDLCWNQKPRDPLTCECEPKPEPECAIKKCKRGKWLNKKKCECMKWNKKACK